MRYLLDLRTGLVNYGCPRALISLEAISEPTQLTAAFYLIVNTYHITLSWHCRFRLSSRRPGAHILPRHLHGPATNSEALLPSGLHRNQLSAPSSAQSEICPLCLGVSLQHLLAQHLFLALPPWQVQLSEPGGSIPGALYICNAILGRPDPGTSVQSSLFHSDIFVDLVSSPFSVQD